MRKGSASGAAHGELVPLSWAGVTVLILAVRASLVAGAKEYGESHLLVRNRLALRGYWSQNPLEPAVGVVRWLRAPARFGPERETD